MSQRTTYIIYQNFHYFLNAFPMHYKQEVLSCTNDPLSTHQKALNDIRTITIALIPWHLQPMCYWRLLLPLLCLEIYPSADTLIDVFLAGFNQVIHTLSTLLGPYLSKLRVSNCRSTFLLT